MMMRRKILLILCICYCCRFMMTAQSPRPAAPPSESLRVNSVYMGVTGGLSIPFSHIATTQSIGGFGQGEIFVFVTENITVGTDFSYHYFQGKDKNINIAMQEVLINGAYYFKSSWNPHMSLGLGYYGEPGTSHFGMVPGIGVMPKIANNIYFTARASAVFFNMDGHFFKIGAGFVFMVYRHKPMKK